MVVPAQPRDLARSGVGNHDATVARTGSRHGNQVATVSYGLHVPVASKGRMPRVRVIALVLALAACDEAADRPATFSYIHAAILEPSCTTAGCHSSLTAAAGVSLAGREGAYTVLTGRVCGEPIRPQDPPRNYVVPGAAEYSQLLHQLRGTDRDVMPPDTPLPAVEIELVARWIDAGAACD